MDNSILIYMVMLLFMMIGIIILSYYIFLNFYDETIKKYINDTTIKLISTVNILNCNKDDILKKIYNELTYINIKFVDIINNDSIKKKDNNNKVIKDTYDFPFLLIIAIFIIIFLILLFGLSQQIKCNKTITIFHILKNILKKLFISIIFLSIMQYLFLYYMLKNIIKINIKDIIINIIQKLKNKSKYIQYS
jgi:hypothetical protein